ncbi:unnamed protein product [Prunus brigantina]
MLIKTTALNTESIAPHFSLFFFFLQLYLIVEVCWCWKCKLKPQFMGRPLNPLAIYGSKHDLDELIT